MKILELGLKQKWRETIYLAMKEPLRLNIITLFCHWAQQDKKLFYLKNRAKIINNHMWALKALNALAFFGV